MSSMHSRNILVAKMYLSKNKLKAFTVSHISYICKEYNLPHEFAKVPGRYKGHDYFLDSTIVEKR